MRDDQAFLFELRLVLHSVYSNRGPQLCRIFAYDANHTDPKTGHMRIDVEVWLGSERIFARGETYCAVNRWTAIDSDAAKELVLSLVSWADSDNGYTDEQRAFVSEFGDEISLVKESRYGNR